MRPEGASACRRDRHPRAGPFADEVLVDLDIAGLLQRPQVTAEVAVRGLGERLQARELVQAADSQVCISPLVKCECLVGPIRRGDLVLKRRYLELFETFVLLAMPDEVYLQAAELRARFTLKTPDALHLACAQHHGCAGIWTNDDRLAQAAYGLARNILNRPAATPA